MVSSSVEGNSDKLLLELAQEPFASKFDMSKPVAVSALLPAPFDLGSFESWVPYLGKPIWRPPEHSPAEGYFTYVSELSDGARVGYVRIPDYNTNVDRLRFFSSLTQFFERDTQAMVIDQVGNPGGSMIFMYSILSHLIQEPVEPPPHTITIWEEDLEEATQALKNPSNDRNEKISYFRRIVSEHSAGRGKGDRPTTPLFLSGIEQVPPSNNPYTKPIVVLNSSLTMSAGEFLSAMLKESNRAVFFGEGTRGAGGCVRPVTYSSSVIPLFGTLTWTLGRRTNGEFIENVGIDPDVSYEIQAEEDIRSEDPYRSAIGFSMSGFQGYRAALLDVVSNLVEDPSFVFAQRPNDPAPIQNTEFQSRLEAHRAWRRSRSKTSTRERFDFLDRADVDLSSDDLAFIGMTNSNLRGSDFRNSKLSFANFYRSNLESSDFSSADLACCFFKGANLKCCSFRDADLRKAVFQGADLRGSDFSGANLQDSVFKGAVITDAVGLTDDQLKTAYRG